MGSPASALPRLVVYAKQATTPSDSAAPRIAL
jgi:hypothetical protein